MSLIPGNKTGKVGKISVKPGDSVQAGDILVNVETGKGNRPVKAPELGIIKKIMCEEGGEVTTGQVLFELDAAQPETVQQTETPSEAKKTTDLETELLIIGAGPGGYVAAIYAAKKGIKTTLVEKEELGGTCLNVGCIPTKALIKSSEICRNVRSSAEFGIVTDSAPRVDMAQVIRRKDAVREKLVSGIAALLEGNGVQILRGSASFLSENKVSVEGKENYTVSARDIIIATGSKISRVNIPGIDLPVVMNSTKALSCTELPKSITIIGGGVIGMEFAFLYNNLGVKVHVVEFLDSLLAVLDKDISESIRDLAEKAGISIHTGSKVMKIQESDDGQAIITYEGKSGEGVLVSDKVLVAIGREPNLDGLAIEKSGVRLRGKGIEVDAHMRTNVEHIYAIGDVTNILQLAHVASHQGMAAVDNISGESVSVDYSAIPNVVFTSPEISSVGLTEEGCQKQGMDCSVSTISYSSNGKALTMNEPEGFIKIVRDNATRRIVGGSIIGADASSLVSVLTLAISNGMTDRQIAETVFAHPTTAEIIHEAALGFGAGAIHQL